MFDRGCLEWMVIFEGVMGEKRKVNGNRVAVGCSM